MSAPRIKRTYQEPGTGRWVTEDYGRVRPAQEEIEDTITRWERDSRR